MQHGDFRKLLYNAAISNGAKVRLNTRVVHVDPDNRTATLAGGEVLRADVVVGADGVDGLSRQIFEDEEAKPTTMNLYRCGCGSDGPLTISYVIQYDGTKEIDNGKPGPAIFLQSPLRASLSCAISQSYLIKVVQISMFCFFGNSRLALGYPLVCGFNSFRFQN